MQLYINLCIFVVIGRVLVMHSVCR